MIETILLIAAVIAGLALAIVAYAATKPDIFTVKRSQRIAAPAGVIYPMIANLKSMNTWNPFVQPDPAIQISYAGPESGAGARHTWKGNRNVGEGQIEIVDAQPSSRVAMKLDMLKPMEAHNDVEFTLEPDEHGTLVTWSMTGRQPLIGKLMTIFIDCDKMVGAQFEKGLLGLKAFAEK